MLFIDNLMCYILGFGCGVVAIVLFKDLLSKPIPYKLEKILKQRCYDEGYRHALNNWDRKEY